VALRIAEKAALSDVGRQRQGNEDSYLERSPLFAVADGMGGARAGEVASRMAVEQFEADFDSAEGTPEEQLADVVRAANRQIYKLAQEDSEHAGMGTTLTSALVTGNEISIGHVGDSRLYRFRGGDLERLTHDHSLVEEFVRQGKLTPAEAEVHPQRSIITRALGTEPEVEVDTYTFAGRDGDIYLINSDGLTGMASEEIITEILQEGGPLEEVAQKLIQAANDGGGRDNITVVLFRLESDGTDDEDPETLGGQATKPGVLVDDVRDAISARTTAARDVPAGADKTAPRDVPDETQPRDVPEGDGEGTLKIPRDDATRARSQLREKSGATPMPPSSSGPKRRPPPHGARKRRRIAGALVLLALAAVIVGLYAGSRQFWFVGTDGRGQIALYRGLPYDLPLGIKLYTKEYQSAVPALSVERRKRNAVLDHRLRSHGEAATVVRELEREHTSP
jgi:protein phosphatase